MKYPSLVCLVAIITVARAWVYPNFEYLAVRELEAFESDSFPALTARDKAEIEEPKTLERGSTKPHTLVQDRQLGKRTLVNADYDGGRVAHGWHNDRSEHPRGHSSIKPNRGAQNMMHVYEYGTNSIGNPKERRNAEKCDKKNNDEKSDLDEIQNLLAVRALRYLHRRNARASRDGYNLAYDVGPDDSPD